MADPSQTDAPVVCGKYVLERPLARGGMGAIWSAYDPQLKRRVALKTMHKDVLESGAALDRFEREATTIAQLQSPHVVQVFDFGVSDSVPYIAMELLGGEDLAARLDRVRRLPVETFGPILVQMGKALTAAHAAGIIHRDLKPSNVFMTQVGKDEVIKLVDFGIAAVGSTEEDAAGRSGVVVGTPHYMSPEQARGRPIDHRSDLWSLAVVSYQALTGELPFNAKNIGDVIVAVCADAIVPPSTIVPELGSAIDRFFARAFERDRASRFQSAQEMVAAFLLAAEPTASARGAKILVVDDEPDMPSLVRQRFRRRIQDQSLSFLFAADGLEALSLLRQHADIDVVVSDIRMPHMDGLTMLAHVAELSPLTKVILVSAFGDMGNIREAMNKGAFDFLIKPVNFKDLQATVDKTVAHVQEAKRTQRSARENEVLRMFVNHDIVNRLPASLRGSSLHSEEAIDATVLYVAIGGLRPLLHAGETQRAIDIANRAFEVVVPEIFSRGGSIVRFTEEGVLALFQDEEHRRRAIAAAIGARTEIRRRTRRDAEELGEVSVKSGLGTGRVVPGAVGAKSLRRLEYTVLGYPVRAAMSLAEAAKADQILAEQSSFEGLGAAIQSEPAGSLEIPGGGGPTQIVNILQDRPERPGQNATQTTVLLAQPSVVLTHPAHDGAADH